MLLGDGKTCSDIDECAERNGGCANECQNVDGGYQEWGWKFTFKPLF